MVHLNYSDMQIQFIHTWYEGGKIPVTPLNLNVPVSTDWKSANHRDTTGKIESETGVSGQEKEG